MQWKSDFSQSEVISPRASAPKTTIWAYNRSLLWFLLFAFNSYDAFILIQKVATSAEGLSEAGRTDAVFGAVAFLVYLLLGAAKLGGPPSLTSYIFYLYALKTCTQMFLDKGDIEIVSLVAFALVVAQMSFIDTSSTLQSFITVILTVSFLFALSQLEGDRSNLVGIAAIAGFLAVLYLGQLSKNELLRQSAKYRQKLDTFSQMMDSFRDSIMILTPDSVEYINSVFIQTFSEAIEHVFTRMDSIGNDDYSFIEGAGQPKGERSESRRSSTSKRWWIPRCLRKLRKPPDRERRTSIQRGFESNIQSLHDKLRPLIDLKLFRPRSHIGIQAAREESFESLTIQDYSLRELTALNETQLANAVFRIVKRDFGSNTSQIDNPTASDNDHIHSRFVKIHKTTQSSDDGKVSFTLRIIDISTSFNDPEEEEDEEKASFNIFINTRVPAFLQKFSQVVSKMAKNGCKLLEGVNSEICAPVEKLVMSMAHLTKALPLEARGLLDLASIMTGQFEQNLKKFNIRETVHRVIERFQLEAEKKNIKFDVVFKNVSQNQYFGVDRNRPNGLIRQNSFMYSPLVFTDQTRFTYILYQLVKNGVEFTAAGSIEVLTEIVEEEKDRHFISIQVQDTGVGMSIIQQGELQKTLDSNEFSYQQSWLDTEEDSMRISDLIARQFGSKLSFTSIPVPQEMNGSTFRFRFELFEPDEEDSEYSDYCSSVSSQSDDESRSQEDYELNSVQLYFKWQPHNNQASEMESLSKRSHNFLGSNYTFRKKEYDGVESGSEFSFQQFKFNSRVQVRTGNLSQREEALNNGLLASQSHANLDDSIHSYRQSTQLNQEEVSMKSSTMADLISSDRHPDGLQMIELPSPKFVQQHLGQGRLLQGDPIFPLSQNDIEVGFDTINQRELSRFERQFSRLEFSELQKQKKSEPFRMFGTFGRITNKKVLIVHDKLEEIQNLEIILKVKIKLDPNCLERSTNGQEAVKIITDDFAKNLYRESSYAIIFMGCNLPGISGFKASRLIRECLYESGGLDINKQPIITAIVDRAGRGTMKKCVKSGMNQALSKPLQLDSLQHACKCAGIIKRKSESVTPSMVFKQREGPRPRANQKEKRTSMQVEAFPMDRLEA